MPIPIQTLRASDYDDLMRHLSLSFAKDRPDWFAVNLPVCYQPTDTAMGWNYAVREDGRIAAAVGLFPMTLRAGGVDLKMGGIGGVSCNPEYRGKGYMSALLERAARDLRGQGYDLSWLGGQRQRYRHYGWEQAGTMIKAQVAGVNLRHHFAKAPPPQVEVTPLPRQIDDATRTALMRLHDAQPYRCVRPAGTFVHRLWNWENQPHVIRDRAGQAVGYVCLSPDGKVAGELVAATPQAAVDALRVLVPPTSDGWRSISVELCPLPSSSIRAIAAFAERLDVVGSFNWQVVNWPKVLSAVMAAQHAAAPLVLGETTIGVTGAGVFRLAVTSAGPVCEPTRARPALELDALTMTQALFGPTRPSQVVTLPREAAILDAWCPLPLWIGRQDEL